VDEVAARQVFLQIFWFHPVSIHPVIPALLHVHLCMIWDVARLKEVFQGSWYVGLGGTC
jgi:hypothetical protein